VSSSATRASQFLAGFETSKDVDLLRIWTGQIVNNIHERVVIQSRLDLSPLHNPLRLFLRRFLVLAISIGA